MLAVGVATVLTCLVNRRNLASLGWRGFLVPELAKFMSFTSVALTSGLIWAVWH